VILGGVVIDDDDGIDFVEVALGGMVVFRSSETQLRMVKEGILVGS
jgi:hypothetical protein